MGVWFISSIFWMEEDGAVYMQKPPCDWHEWPRTGRKALAAAGLPETFTGWLSSEQMMIMAENLRTDPEMEDLIWQIDNLLSVGARLRVA